MDHLRQFLGGIEAAQTPLRVEHILERGEPVRVDQNEGVELEGAQPLALKRLPTTVSHSIAIALAGAKPLPRSVSGLPTAPLV